MGAGIVGVEDVNDAKMRGVEEVDAAAMVRCVDGGHGAQ